MIIFNNPKMAENILHSHIKNLEITKDGKVKNNILIDHETARKKLKTIMELTQSNIPTTSIISYENNSGISALITAYQRESPTLRILSEHIDSIEKLRQYLRMCVVLKIRETKDIYEGEVIEMDFKGELKITLKSLKGSKTLKFSSSLFTVIQNENITVGDIIYVECNSGIIKRLGRSESCMQDNELESEKYLSIPKGELLTKREIVQTCTLHDLDFANLNSNSGDFGMILNSLNIQKNSISENLRNDIDGIVSNFIQMGKCTVELHTLVVEVCNNLDSKFIAYLDFSSNERFKPTVLLMCNKKEWFKLNDKYLCNLDRKSVV